ncbi:MAG: beta-ketoacyl-ACP reductase [Bacilli bacterium]
MRLQNKVALVTGAANGIGQEIALVFAKQGALVIACDVNPINCASDNIIGYQLDVTNPQQIETVVNEVISKYQRIDVLVNNAGITKDALTSKMSDEMFDQVINVNLKGVFNLTRAIGPLMVKQGQGSIINISSVVGEYGNIGQANYAASKAGVIGMSKTWAKEFAMKGQQVRVNAIAPGYIMTDILKTVPEDLINKFAQMTMLKRLGEPIEIANVALFLASDEASYVTGHVLSVNGGMRL